MGKRISESVREEAAVLCAISASQRGMGFEYLANCTGASPDAVKLAYDAWGFAWLGLRSTCSEADAEAEALIRCGWEPSNGR